MFHPILDIGNKLNWDPVVRNGWEALPDGNNGTIPIPDKSFLTSAHLFMIACSNPDALSHWKAGCFASQLMLASPTTYQAQFLDLVEGEHRTFIPLNRWKLVRFPDYGLNPYLINISIPRWHKKIYLEIWSYSGVNSDSIEAALEQIQAK